MFVTKDFLEDKLGGISPHVYNAACDAVSLDVQQVFDEGKDMSNEAVLQLLVNSIEFYRKYEVVL